MALHTMGRITVSQFSQGFMLFLPMLYGCYSSSGRENDIFMDEIADLDAARDRDTNFDLELDTTPDGADNAPDTVADMNADDALDVGDDDAEPVIQTWIVAFESNEDEGLFKIAKSRDGGIIAAGATSSFGTGNADIWIVKLAGDGRVLWQKSIGGEGMYYVFSISESSDGHLFAAGLTDYTDLDSSDMWVAKLDGSGNVIWKKETGSGMVEIPYSVIQDSDGNLIVAGFVDLYDLDVLVLKMESSGNVVWSRTYENVLYWSRELMPKISAIECRDRGIIVVRGAVTFGQYAADTWILKIDGNGDILWQETLGGDGNDAACGVVETTDGGLILSGSTNSFGDGDYDFWAVKLDHGGELLWQKTVGGSGDDIAYTMTPSRDHGFVIAGMTESFGDSRDMWAVKLDSSGNVLWQKAIGGESYDFAMSVAESSDGGIVLTGIAGAPDPFSGINDEWIIKLAGNGQFYGPCGLITTTHAEIRASHAEVRPTDSIPRPRNETVRDPDFLQHNSDDDPDILCPE